MTTETTKQNRITVVLDEPIKRGETLIESLELRRPTAGELRGSSMFGVARTEVDALITLLPRVTSPALIEAEVLRMDAADLMQCGLALASFCMPKAVLANAEHQVG